MSGKFVTDTLPSLAPAGCIKESIETRCQKLITSNSVMLFMKGTPESPECGFSRKMVALLAKYVGSVIPMYGHFNVYSDQEVRDTVKKISKWPTYPQLYANG
jgi:glutaredoxin-related protein